MKGKSFKPLWLLVFPVLFVLTGTIREITSKRTNEIIVYNTPGSPSIGIRTGKILKLYSDTSVIAPDIKRHCAILGLKLQPVVLRNDFYFLKAGEKTILLTRDIKDDLIKNNNPGIIILTGSKPGYKEYSPGSYRKLIVVSSASGKGFRLPVKNKNSNDSVYYIRNSGAFVKRI